MTRQGGYFVKNTSVFIFFALFALILSSTISFSKNLNILAQHVAKNHGNPQLFFEPNVGQADANTAFLVRSLGYTAFSDT
jgi:hypothetical protein